jgi:hypothetical protein
VSYQTVGHTHNDGDGEMGTTASQISNDNIQTIDVFDELCRAAFEKNRSSNTITHKIIGITDYGKLFSSGKSNPHDINGMYVYRCFSSLSKIISVFLLKVCHVLTVFGSLPTRAIPVKWTATIWRITVRKKAGFLVQLL